MNIDTLKKAYEYAYEKHIGQYRRGGISYITHPVAVAEILYNKGYGEDYLITALFHDLLEDTTATDEEILFLSNEKVLEAVKLLTKTSGYVMSEYIQNIKLNDIAFAVKGADRVHNLSSAFVCDETFKRRYILESVEWFLDFDEQIPKLVYKLSKTLEDPIIGIDEKLKGYNVE